MIRNSASEMASKLASGEITSVALTQAHLDQITAVDKDVHAFLHVDTQGALAQAAAVDAKRKRGEKLSPLAGVPLALKDVMTQKGIPTVGFGPLGGDLSQNGRHDEWVDVDDYIRAIKVAAGTIMGWCGAAAE